VGKDSRHLHNPGIASEDTADADVAGQNAAKRGIDLALEQGMDVKIIQIPAGAGKDADECVRKNSATWFKAVENSQEIMVWYFANNLVDIDKKTPREKQEAVEIVLKEIIRLPFAVERDHWLKKLTEVTKIDLKILQEETRRLADVNKNKHAPIYSQDKDLYKVVVNIDRHQILLQNLWSLFLKYPALLLANINSLQPDYFIASPLLKLYELAIEQYNNKGQVEVDFLRDSLPIEERQIIDVLILKVESEFTDFNQEKAEKELAIILLELNQLWVKKCRRELIEESRLAAEKGDKADVERIMKKITEIGKKESD